MKKWIVCVHIFPNNKKYFGITSKKPNDRWEGGSGYGDNQPVMKSAIAKYIGKYPADVCRWIKNNKIPQEYIKKGFSINKPANDQHLLVNKKANNFSVGTNDLSQAMEIASSGLATYGNEFSEILGLVTAGTEIMQGRSLICGLR